MNPIDVVFILLIVGAVVGAVVLFVLIGYRSRNRLAPLRERITETACNIKTCIQKRNRLVKQLLNVATTYAKHERELHERISADFNATPQMACQSIAYVSHLMNTFPELRADRTYMRLMQDLSNLESELQQKVEEHNARARDYNSIRSSFPHHLFAFGSGFEVAQYLDTTEYASPDAENTIRRPTVFPRVGMKFRNTDDDSLAEITMVDPEWIKFVFIPSRGGSTDGAVDRKYWSEEVKVGRYHIE